MTTEFSFKSPFAPLLEGFINEKRSLGYKYDTEIRMLKQFDQHCSVHIMEPILTEKLVKGYVYMDKNRSVKTQLNIIGLLREFSLFLTRQGWTSWYFPDELSPKKENTYIPYIFSSEEVQILLNKSEKLAINPQFPTRHLTLPLIYHTLYCCGMRVSEVTGLTIENVDLETGTLLIKNTKAFRDRIIPLTKSLTVKYQKYFDRVHSISNPKDYFFQSDYGNRYCTTAIENQFRELLWECDIPYHGRKKGPHLHDLRHAFTVHCLQKAMNENKDIYEFLPVLSTYLGHSTLEGTQKYLHLTAEIYPDILKKVENYCDGIIPKGGVGP